ncbi:uncharacterized protein B0I36DRAFT_397465 [Microdochium trichocladiopsis]|uniref:Uncharacterized protein n=1 Tax=Microdochium trichocladiopsis TaxID=1682393 RepID=A0A9P8XRL3_9PEZI|nr:uncharacterized protein B0I36DRAFT_397465 [Microdochium trichocladiopsis]KAH7014123.1 hypothetical protein B0I36DRAFT_397465 [Microdochium trichocladiopsis]
MLAIFRGRSSASGRGLAKQRRKAARWSQPGNIKGAARAPILRHLFALISSTRTRHNPLPASLLYTVHHPFPIIVTQPGSALSLSMEPPLTDEDVLSKALEIIVKMTEGTLQIDMNRFRTAPSLATLSGEYGMAVKLINESRASFIKAIDGDSENTTGFEEMIGKLKSNLKSHEAGAGKVLSEFSRLMHRLSSTNTKKAGASGMESCEAPQMPQLRKLQAGVNFFRPLVKDIMDKTERGNSEISFKDLLVMLAACTVFDLMEEGCTRHK